MKEKTMPKMLTINEEAALGIFTASALRRMLAEGRLPGVYSGSRFYIHHEMLMEQLDRECRARMGVTIPAGKASGDGGQMVILK